LTHAVDWYLEVLRVLNIPVHWDFVWLPERPEAARSLQKKWNPGNGPWVALNPGARWPNKRWPIEYYAELVRQLSARDVHLAILGDKNDASLGASLSKVDPRRCLDLTGRTTISEMIEWVRLSALLVSNDTGPMHIGAALGKPVVAIFGPTEPRRTGPYRQMDHVLRVSLPCAPCLKATCNLETPLECLRAVSPVEVCAAVDRILNSGRAPVEAVNTNAGRGVD
jgi:lipopolysaccharide heptosyltransferase II